MAEYKNSIRLGIALENEKDVNGRLQTLINTLEKNKINLNINIENSDVAKQLEALTNLANNFKNSLGGKVSLGNINEIINQTVVQAEKLNGELQKVSRTDLGNGLYKQTELVATGLGEITKQTGTVQKIGDEFNYTGSAVRTATSDLVGYDNALLKIEKAQSSLSNLKLVDQSKVSNLSSNLNANNIGSNNELKNLLNQVKALENEEKNLQQIQNQAYSEMAVLQKEEYSLKQNLITADGTYKSELESRLVTVNQLKSAQQQNIQDNNLTNRQKELELTNQQVKLQEQLNQSKARQTDVSNANDLRTLQQEQELLQKQEQAYQQINVLKSNGVINTSEISKLEQLVRSASSIKDINSALSSIGQSTSRETSISTLTKQIQEAQTKLEQMKTTFGGKLPSGFIQSTETELNKLLADLKQVDGTNFTGIKNSLNSVNSSMKQTTSETQQLVSSLNQASGSSFFSNMSNFLGKIGVFYGVQQVVQEISKQFKDASDYTLTLDKNLSNIQMITGQTKEQVIAITNSFKELGAQLHTTNVEIMSGAEEMMRAGYSDEDSKKMLEQATIGSKISGQTTQQVSEQLITLKNSFDMSADSMSHVIDIFSKMDNTSATSFKEIASAIQRTAYSAQEAKVPLDTLTAYVTTVSEKTRRSAETIGESFKTIFSRYQNVKLGSLDEDGKSINDVEKAMNKIGISIRTNRGEFKDFNSVLEQFMAKIKAGSINQTEMLAGVQTLAGTRQKESLLALVNNMDALKQHTEDMTTATGSAKKMFDDVYANSLDAKVNDLKRAFEGLYETMLSSDSLKWLVTGFTQLVTALSQVDGKTIAFIGTVGLATVAISKLATMNKLLMEATSANAVIGGFTKLIGILTGMTPLMGTTTVATQALVGVQAEATLVTEALVQAEARALLATEALTVAQEGQATSAFAIGVAEAEVMLATDALTIAQGEAVIATEALAVAEAEVVIESAGLTGVAGAWALVTGGIESAVVASLEFMMTPIGLVIGALAITIGIAGKAWYDYKQHEAEVETQSKSLKTALDGVNESLKNHDTKGASDNLDKLAESEKKYQDALEKKKKIEKEIADVQDDMANNPLNGEGDLQVLQMLQGELGEVTKELNTQEEAFKKAGVSAEEYAFAQSEVANAKISDKIKEDTKAQLENRENLEGAKEEYNNFIKTTQDLYTEYQNLSVQENLSAEQKTRLGEVCQQLQGKFTDLKVSVDENGVAHIENSKLVSDNISYLSSEGMTIETLTMIRESDSKATSEWSIGNQQMTYQEVVNNIANYQAEIDALSKLSQAKVDTSGIGVSGTLAIGGLEQAGVGYENLLKDNLSELESAKKKADSIYGSIKAPVNNVGSGGGGGSYSPSGGGKEKKVKDYTEEISKLKSTDDIDRYADVNSGLTLINNSLKENKLLQDATTGTEHQNALKQELALYEQKRTAIMAIIDEQKKDMEERKTALQQSGFEFDANGKLLNGRQKLLELQQQANALGGNTEAEKTAKEDAIKNVKTLIDDTKEYTDLVNTKIPENISQWEELANTIKKTQQETVSKLRDELVGDLKSQYEEDKDTELGKLDDVYKADKERLEKEYKDDSENLKKRKESEIDFYQQQIDKLQKELDDIDNDSVEKKTKLAKLQAELKLWQKDSSVFSKAKQENLSTEISKLQKDIKKDDLKSQIDALKKEQDAKKTTQDTELDDLKTSNDKQKDELESSYNKQKQIAEDKYKEMLKEKNLYIKADEMMTKNQQDQMIELLKKYDTSYKDVGLMLSKSLTDPFLERIKAVQEAMKGLGIASTDVSSSGSSESISSNNYESKTDSGASYTKTDGGIFSDKPLSDEEIKKIYASYDTGGRTPSNISSSGATAILHANEKILNVKDTNMLDEIAEYVKSSGVIVSQLSNQYGNLGNYTMPSLGTNLNDLTNGVTNNNSNINTNNSPISMPVTIINEKGSEQFTEQKLFKSMNKWQREQGRTYR